ncbi:hypothetical protein RvVAR031_15590 [Agrobacterium vitis]|nr:hypothetical protein RvVAR031_15590 [Agrobacterium vitis]
MHVVTVDRAGMNLHLLRSRYLSQKLPATLANISLQNRKTILRHPNKVILAIPYLMAAGPIILHKWMLPHPVA